MFRHFIILAFLFFSVACSTTDVLPWPWKAEKGIATVAHDSPVSDSNLPKTPFLRLNSTMHTAMIRRIAIDRNGRWLVTASEDKTARVWEIRSGKLLHVLRPPIDDGHEGKLYAVALSPNGETVAVGGYTGYQWEQQTFIYLFSRRSGELVRRLTGLPNVINHLAFSTTGEYLAAALGGSNGIRLFRTSDGQEVFADRSYGADSYWVEFASDGHLVSICDDGKIRLYNAQQTLINQAVVHGGKQPFSARFSPNGSKIAVGFRDSTAVTVVSARDLKVLYQADTSGVNNGNLMSVAWSPDGQGLVAGGTYSDGKFPLLYWANAERGTHQVWPGANNTVMDIRALPTGGFIYGAADPGWGIVSAHGEQIRWQGPEIADFRQNWNLQLSMKGDTVQFAYVQGGQSPVQFDITAQQLNTTTSNFVNDLTPPRTEGLNITDWFGTTAPKLNGQLLPLKPNEMSFSLAITPNGSHFLLGTEWRLRYYDNQGQQVWERPVPGATWSVNIAGNQQIAVAAHADGTLRWYRLNDGTELLALYPHPNRQDWVLWTPQGYYAASPGGEALIGWHVNNSIAQAAAFYPVAAFRDQYYRPNVLMAVLDTQDVQLALQREEGNRPPVIDLTSRLPPTINILSPQEGDGFEADEITVHYRVDAPAKAPISVIQVKLNGSITDTWVATETKDEQVIKVKLPPQDIILSLLAKNDHGVAQDQVSLRWQGETTAIFKPNLYVLAVGVSEYESNDLSNLSYTDDDARDFANVMSQQQGKLYHQVSTKVLINSTKDEILQGLTWLERETTSRDIAMLMLSGHGVKDSNQRYYFLPRNTKLDDLKTTAVPHHDIRDTLSAIAGKRILFLDSCHAGQVMKGIKSRGGDMSDLNLLASELADAENGVVVFTASSGRQFSLESEMWEHGAFTKALLEALEGQADFIRDDGLTIDELGLFISKRVKELTGGKQTPYLVKPQGIPNFPIAATN